MNDGFKIGVASHSANAGDWVALTDTTLTCSSGTIDYGYPTTTGTVSGTSWTIDDKYLEYTTPYDMADAVKYACQPIVSIPNYSNNKKGDDDMRYLYEVILVNPKDDEFEVFEMVAKTETSALMQAYNDSVFNERDPEVPFDDLKTYCRVLMEWKKEKSLEKALETIKKAIE